MLLFGLRYKNCCRTIISNSNKKFCIEINIYLQLTKFELLEIELSDFELYEFELSEFVLSEFELSEFEFLEFVLSEFELSY